ncbi:MAG: hypothetical protein H6838_08165 [Planctomycetes bacterium]|nr:hypothetical protein [Planctomycetota bacterium]
MVRRTSAWWLILGLTIAGCAANAAQRSSAAFIDLVGDYRGVLQIQGGSSPREVAMGLLVEPIAGQPDLLRWQLEYGEHDRRDYVLCIDDRAEGRCRIDERNGIELHATFLAGELVAVFATGGQTIVTRYRLVPAGIEFSLEAFAADQAQATGQEVTTFARVARQRALLRRR